jgi:hypothetical protein
VITSHTDDRTLSIHVTDTQSGRDETLAKNQAGKKEIKELSQLKWHTLPRDEVLQRLGCSDKVGLDVDMATKRLQKNGPNEVTPHRPNLFFK